MLRLVTRSFPDAALDTALSTVLLRRVAAGTSPPTLRLFVPGRVVAFGRQDAVRAGYRRAVAAVAGLGYAPVERLAGGRAAVFHEQTIAFAWSRPVPDPRSTITTRFEEISGIMAGALRSLGVDARVGEVPGEYCPGAYSVNARGAKKLMGVGQRLVRGAAHVGGVVVVDRVDLVNAPLVPAYAALGYEWDPGATGAVSDEVYTTLADVQAAIGTAFAEAGHELTDGDLDTGELLDTQAAASADGIP
jgi:octanoyl-[GcvH]:protein N-octanoyltransferase